jgi:hypothetical protein
MHSMRYFPYLGMIAFLIAGTIGCGPSRPTTYPVKGAVMHKGKPLAEAIVVFHPEGPDHPQKTSLATYTDAEGKFELTTSRLRDGALPGNYRVTVVLRAPRLVGEETVRDGRNLLPAKYAKPETSGFQYEVKPGDNDVPTFQIADR